MIRRSRRVPHTPLATSNRGRGFAAAERRETCLGGIPPRAMLFVGGGGLTNRGLEAAAFALS